VPFSTLELDFSSQNSRIEFLLAFLLAQAMTDAERFREQAAECRQLAETAHDPRNKEAWLRLSADWLKLAQEADSSSPYF
jgi:hypothetical protein